MPRSNLWSPEKFPQTPSKEEKGHAVPLRSVRASRSARGSASRVPLRSARRARPPIGYVRWRAATIRCATIRGILTAPLITGTPHGTGIRPAPLGAPVISCGEPARERRRRASERAAAASSSARRQLRRRRAVAVVMAGRRAAAGGGSARGSSAAAARAANTDHALIMHGCVLC